MRIRSDLLKDLDLVTAQKSQPVNPYYMLGVAYTERSKWRYVRNGIWMHAAAHGGERGVHVAIQEAWLCA